MSSREAPAPAARKPGFLAALLRDRSGNAMAIVAGALLPLMALIGGGIDMGRGYLAESRLQAACDAGVLAARKKLGSAVAVGGVIPADVGTTGQNFFRINFPDNVYGTENHSFTPTLETDYAISGVASADVPTTIMKIFAFEKLAVRVQCEAKLNFSNTDLMLVLDTTKSMETETELDHVTMTRLAALKSVVHDFYLQVNASRTPGTIIRYGFMPYANNVNVGGDLSDAWVATTWDYQSRVQVADHVGTTTTYEYGANWTSVLNGSGAYGTYAEDEFRRYAATYTPPSGETGVGSYSCPIAAPSGDWSGTTTTTVTPRAESPVGSGIYVTKKKWTGNAVDYYQNLDGANCITTRYRWTNYAETYDYIEEPYTPSWPAYDYKPVTTTFTDWRTQASKCIEERKTSKLHDFTDFNAINVNTDYLDLNIDLLPTPGIPATQWKPAHPSVIYLRGIDYYGNGTPSPAPILDTTDDYMHPQSTAYKSGLTACPAAAMKLTQLDNNVAAIDGYLATLTAPDGVTYHDIGMIWGGRYLSKDGIFATENADAPDKPTNRHLIFMTDGQTETHDIAYSAYGIEGLDNRRIPAAMLGTPGALDTLVERRFAFACEEVKKKNITVWVIGFGTTLSQKMMDCAGDDHHWFNADDADELAEAFATIGASMGDLRITK